MTQRPQGSVVLLLLLSFVSKGGLTYTCSAEANIHLGIMFASDEQVYVYTPRQQTKTLEVCL